MGFPPTDKSLAGLLRDFAERLNLVERRLVIGSPAAPAPPAIRGTTALRNSTHGVPATAAEQAALANQMIVWFNTDKGWAEIYYATTGTAGLTVLGLQPGHASGWYPVAGADVMARRGKIDGYQNITTPAVPIDPTLAAMDINRGGFLDNAAAGLTVPYGGRYQVHGSVYYTGGTATNAVQWARLVNDGVIVADHLSQRPTGATDQMEQVTTVTTIVAGKVISLAAMTQGSGSAVYGITRIQTFIEVQYLGPPLANG